MPNPLVFSESIVGPVADEFLDFRCTLESGLDAAWICVGGELDIATAPRLEQALREAWLCARRVVIDLRGLAFMDCSGLSVIVDAGNRARQTGRRLVLVRGPWHVDRLFALTGTSDAHEIVDLDRAEPLQALEKLAQSDAA
jgi:anti-sigma B factor antagonist